VLSTVAVLSKESHYYYYYYYYCNWAVSRWQ